MAWATPKPASWADEVAGEAEAGTLQVNVPAPDNAAFPTLGEAAKQPPKSKKKGQKMDIHTFMANTPSGPASSAGGRFVVAARLPPSARDILASLPTSSRGKVEGEEELGGMGGAFRDYGGDRGGEPGRMGRAPGWGAAHAACMQCMQQGQRQQRLLRVARGCARPAAAPAPPCRAPSGCCSCHGRMVPQHGLGPPLHRLPPCTRPPCRLWA